MTTPHNDIDRLLHPRRVALIGSTSKPTGLGARALRHLNSSGYPGEILTPQSVDTLEGDVDVAVVAVPSTVAPEVVSKLDGRCEFVIVNSSGFEEVGGRALPRPQGSTLIGPNSVGMFYAPSRTALTFAAAFDDLDGATSGSGVFMVSQSGAFGARLAQLAGRYGVGFDGFVGTGNETYYGACDVVCDLVASEGHRPCAIGLYLESVPDGTALETALTRAASVGVHVVVLLGGTSGSGAAAAASHTAAVSPDGAVVREMCLMLGATFVGSDRELVESSIGLAMLGRARGDRVGIVTGSGGAGVVAADMFAYQDLRLPALSTGLRESLAGVLPAYASTPNPVDITAQVIGDTGVVADVAGLLAHSGEVDAVVVIGRSEHADAVTESVAGAVPAVITALDGGPSSVAGDLSAGRPVLPGLAATSTVLRAVCPVGVYDGGDALGSGPGDSAAHRDPDAKSSLLAVSEAGVCVAPWRAASTAREARAAAEHLGWPVVLKANLPAATHKARHGGVRLDVTSERFDAAVKELLDVAPEVIVAAQLRGSPELVVGVRRDAVLGAVVVAGLGGGHVELLDRTVSVPMSATPAWLAHRLMQQVFARGGTRHEPLARQLAGVADALARSLRQHGYDLIECNPLIPSDDGLVALDARVITHV